MPTDTNYNHRRRLRGHPGHVPPIIENRPCIYHFLPSFCPPNILVCPPNIFDKFTPVLDPENCKEIGEIGDILFGGPRTKKNLGKMTKKGCQKFRNFPKKSRNLLVVRRQRQNLSSGPRVGKG